MPWFLDDRERARAEAVRVIATVDPFDPRRVAADKSALGDEHRDGGLVWSFRAGVDAHHQNVLRINRLIGPMLERQRALLAGGFRPGTAAIELYQDVALYYLYDQFDLRFQPIIDGETTLVDFYEEFVRAYDLLLVVEGLSLTPPTPLLTFSWFFQIRRAFFFIYRTLLGASLPAARLRSFVWRAIFSYNLRDYLNTVYLNMDNVPLHITGATGTGKELVASAVGHARFLLYSVATRSFPGYHPVDYHTVNLTEIARSVFESEMFGHEQGAFTGAIAAKPGRLEHPQPGGTMLFDEIAEVPMDLQATLLRVVQTREIFRVGGKQKRRFHGKLITATHKDLDAEVRAGRFRQDLQQRICVDLVKTPTLREQLDDAPDERRYLVQVSSAKLLGAETAARRAEELDYWLGESIPEDHPWEGNMRELEGRVLRLVMHGPVDAAARPARKVVLPGEGSAAGAIPPRFGAPFAAGRMTAAEAEARYSTIVLARTGSYRAAAEVLGINWRTLATKIDRALLEELTGKPFEPPGPGRKKRTR